MLRRYLSTLSAKTINSSNWLDGAMRNVVQINPKIYERKTNAHVETITS
jgi:hypothetical protein